MNNHIKIIEGKMYYYNTPIAFVDDYDKILVADVMFRTKELECFLGKSWNVKWVEDIFQSLIASQDEKAPPIKLIRLWFLKPEVDSIYKFISYNQFLQIGGIELPLKSYEMVYCNSFPTNDLDEIYTAFQLKQVDDYSGRVLAMGDVIELYDHTDRAFYYVDKVGFKEISLAL